jgi:hypothetical protein
VSEIDRSRLQNGARLICVNRRWQICRVPSRFSGGRARVFLPLAVLVLTAGCVSAKVNAGFPQVALRKPLSGAVKVGVAPIEDSRSSPVAATMGNLFQEFDLIAGATLLAYVDRQFRNGLSDRGFDPVGALDPSKSALAQPYKVVVLTAQSSNYNPGSIWGSSDGSVSIAIQVYSPLRKMIFADSYAGSFHGRTPFNAGIGLGTALGAAVDQAIAAAFADPRLVQALR